MPCNITRPDRKRKIGRLKKKKLDLNYTTEKKNKQQSIQSTNKTNTTNSTPTVQQHFTHL